MTINYVIAFDATIKYNRRCHGIGENQEQGSVTGVNNTGDNILLVSLTMSLDDRVDYIPHSGTENLATEFSLSILRQ
jgi:hypothetical protein